MISLCVTCGFVDLIDKNKQKKKDYENMNCSDKAEKNIQSLKESVYKFKKEIQIKERENNKLYDKNSKEMKQKRDDEYKKVQNTNDTELWTNFKQIRNSRNKYSKMIKNLAIIIQKMKFLNLKATVKQCGEKLMN